MKYLICKKMAGEGCDYTIGCGMRFDFIEANSFEHALEKTVWPEGRKEYSSLEGECELSDILIIPAEAVHIVDVPAITNKIKEDRKIADANKKEQEEREMLAKLQAKYST